MREQRKVVTVVFADVVGSTSFAAHNDPEVVRSRMSRYFKRVTDIAHAYGGTVEKFAGDAAMVVFGVPAAHDDDAERAVRAALEISRGAAGLPVRVGVNTGEAMTAATEDRQFMVSGDAVNVAARLQQLAESDEVLVGALTHQLTRDVIEYETRAPLAARGKDEPVAAFRAIRPVSDVPIQARGVRGLRAELVGRSRELRLFRETFARAADDRRPHLFTIAGPPGVGKSRLVSEALSTLDGSAARILRGRCLPYGRGITYWPLIEMVQQDAGISVSDERDVALQKLDGWLGETLAEDEQRPATRARLSVMLGFEAPEAVMPDTAADGVAKEISWAMRRYLQSLAKRSPLILVVDDLQWAEPQVVTLIEQLPARLVDAPILVVCIARPEFLESRHEWSSGQANSTTITLDPLSPADTSTLISRLLEIDALPEELRRQIVERSAGTPLFCEEFIQMLIDDGRLVQHGHSWRAESDSATIEVPQSINAVLTARLDALSDDEKRILQAASVVGERFDRWQVLKLVGSIDVEPALDSLRRKGLIGFEDEPGGEYRFRHLLVRDAAYGSLPKSERAALHYRFGVLLEAEAGDPEKLAEILAHHAERAFTLSVELGLEEDVIAASATRALEWSLAMAERARQRDEAQTAEDALQTAHFAISALPDGGSLELRARTALVEAQLMMMRGDYAGGRAAASTAGDLAERAQLLSLVAKARLTEAWISNWSDSGRLDAFRSTVAGAIAAAERAGDRADEIEARHIATNELYALGRLAEFAAINAGLLEQAESIGNAALSAVILDRLVGVEQLRGNNEAFERRITQADALVAKYGLRTAAIKFLRPRALAKVFAGDFEDAERIYRDVLVAVAEAGAVQQQVAGLRFSAYLYLYMDRYGEAADLLDQALALSEQTGEMWNRAEILSMRARAALQLGDIAVAERFIGRALKELRDEDVTGTSEVYNHLGAIRAAGGQDAEAETALRKAVDGLAHTEYYWPRSIAAFDLAEFLARRGRMDEASDVVETYAGICAERGWRTWDAKIARIRALIAGGKATSRT